ncbi:MAG TPA: RnfABCDGE type electron transport complex subunit D [Spirochaetes bacterium]|nr:RnfABCDGE type electron transport complex subunit D [Spirochaetota bacterium]
MKIIADILKKMRPLFNEGGKLSLLGPVFQALDNFLLQADIKTENPPYGRDPMDIKRYMSMVIMALFPCFFASLYFFGWRVLLMMLVSYAAGGAVELLFAIIRKEEINEGFLVTGFIFPLILPPGLPLWIVAVGVFFGVLIGKEVFGGTGRNVFNAALVGRAFLALGYPSTMARSWMPPGGRPWGNLVTMFSVRAPEAITSATPLVMGKSGDLTPPIDLFLGNVAGSAGETSVIALLLGGVFLILVGVSNWRTVLGILLSFTVLAAGFRGLNPSAVTPVWFNLMSGGILFGAFFMATDPVTGPITQSGKWVYGIIIGSVTILIRFFSGFVEGVTFAILLGNIFAPLIDEVVIRNRIRRYARER